MIQRNLLVLLLCVSLAVVVNGDGKVYRHRDKVPVLANTVGSFNNPAETYSYYNLPFCPPKESTFEREDLGGVLSGAFSHAFPLHVKSLSSLVVFLLNVLSGFIFPLLLTGDRREASLYDIRYRVNVEWQVLCAFKLSQNEIKAFMDAISEDYIFELFVGLFLFFCALAVHSIVGLALLFPFFENVSMQCRRSSCQRLCRHD